MPYVAQLTMTNLTGDSKKFTESTALFPSFTKSKEKVELGLRGLILEKKKKENNVLTIFSMKEQPVVYVASYWFLVT